MQEYLLAHRGQGRVLPAENTVIIHRAAVQLV